MSPANQPILCRHGNLLISNKFSGFSMRPDEDWISTVTEKPHLISYRLTIHLDKLQKISVGKLGQFDFPAGYYHYTGSARRNLVARVKRHISNDKKLRWHIDYLLAVKEARVVDIDFFPQSECDKNQQSQGVVIIRGFGASDCKMNCGSHLKYLGANI